MRALRLADMSSAHKQPLPDNAALRDVANLRGTTLLRDIGDRSMHRVVGE